MFRAFLKDENGATAVEYAIIGAMISLTCIAIFSPFGNAITELYGRAAGAFDSVGEP